MEKKNNRVEQHTTQTEVSANVRKFCLHWGGLALIIAPFLASQELRAFIMSMINGFGGVGKAVLFTAAVGAGGMLVNRITGALISPYDTNGKNDCECGRLPAGPTGRVDYFGYIRRDFPSFWIEPWKWVFGGWPIWRGVLNVETGNVTITPKLILWLRKNVDPQGEWLGYHEVVSGHAAHAVLTEKRRIENSVRSNLTQTDLDRLAFIKALIRDGVIFEEVPGTDKVDLFTRNEVEALLEKSAAEDLIWQEALSDVKAEVQALKPKEPCITDSERAGSPPRAQAVDALPDLIRLQTKAITEVLKRNDQCGAEIVTVEAMSQEASPDLIKAVDGLLRAAEFITVQSSDIEARLDAKDKAQEERISAVEAEQKSRQGVIMKASKVVARKEAAAVFSELAEKDATEIAPLVDVAKKSGDAVPVKKSAKTKTKK